MSLFSFNFIFWVIFPPTIESSTSTNVIVVPAVIPVPVTKSPILGIPFSPEYKGNSPLPVETVYKVVGVFGVPPPVITVTAPLEWLDMLTLLALVIVGLLKSNKVPLGAVMAEDNIKVELFTAITVTNEVMFWVAILLLFVTMSPTFIPLTSAGVTTVFPPLTPVTVLETLSITSIGSHGANLATDIWSSVV